MLFLLFLLSILDLLKEYKVETRALMIEPPQRSSLWRFHYKTLMNTEDDLLNCGGYEVHWNRNGGKCGVCGDAWSKPQDHDDGGIYASGIIVRSFHQGSYINVTVEVLNNLLGYFEFRLCPRNSTNEKLTHACFENNVLWIEESWDSRYYPGSRGGIYDIHVRLPASVVCSHCVFQWKFTTGYRMGGNNMCDCMGCGKQEQFYNCADIEIKSAAISDPSVPRYLSVLGSVRTPSFLLSTENSSEATMQHLRDHVPYSRETAGDNVSLSFGRANDTISSRLSTDPGTILNSNDAKLEHLLFPLPKGSSVPGSTFELLSLLNKTIQNSSGQHTSEVTTQNNPTFLRFIAPSQNLSNQPKPHPDTTIKPIISATEIQNPQQIQSNNNTYEGWHSSSQSGNVSGQDRDLFSFGIPFAAISKLFQQRNDFTNLSATHKPKRSHTNLSKNVKTLFRLNKETVTMTPFIPSLQLNPPVLSNFRQKEVNGNGYKCTINSKNFFCKGRGHHANTNGIGQWCILNCRAGNCNLLKFICECGCEEKHSNRCRAIKHFALMKGMNAWCSFVCLSNYCPPSICSVEDCRPRSEK